MTDVTLRRWRGDDDELAQVAVLYADAFAQAPYDEDRAGNLVAFPERVRRYAREKADFRLILAVENEAVVGFVLGTGIAPGDWWRDRLAETLSPDVQTTWLPEESFSVVELAVSSDRRRSGIARELMDAVLAEVPYDTVTLGCYAAAVPARTLYARLGWTPIATDISIAGSPPLWIFGKRLNDL